MSEILPIAVVFGFNSFTECVHEEYNLFLKRTFYDQNYTHIGSDFFNFCSLFLNTCWGATLSFVPRHRSS